MKRMPKFGPRYGLKRFGEGGATAKKAVGKDRVQEAVDAIKRYQDAAERRYKYNTSDPIAFLNEYGQERTYNAAAARAEKDMKEKAAVAKEERAASDAAKKRATEKKAEALAKKAEKYAPGTDPDQKTYRRGGSVKSSASKRADGIAKKGKTRGKMC
jgi:hypothetical protein